MKFDKFRMIFLSLFGCLLFSCAIFRADRNARNLTDYRKNKFGTVSFELVNWRTEEIEGTLAGETMISVLETSAQFRKFKNEVGSDGWYVQVVLEKYPGNKEMGGQLSDRPGRFLLSTINNFIASNTFLFFPVLLNLERKISFLVWKGEKLRNEYVYHSDAWAVLGWGTLLLLIPSESKYLRYDMARVARLFLFDAAQDNLLHDE